MLKPWNLIFETFEALIYNIIVSFIRNFVGQFSLKYFQEYVFYK